MLHQVETRAMPEFGRHHAHWPSRAYAGSLSSAEIADLYPFFHSFCVFPLTPEDLPASAIRFLALVTMKVADIQKDHHEEERPPQLPPHPKRDAPTLLSHLRQIRGTGCNENMTHSTMLEGVEVRAFSDFLGAYNTAEESDFNEYSTELLSLLKHVGKQCSPEEAVQMYILTASMFPSRRWASYCRRLCYKPGREHRKALLEAYLQSTSDFFRSSLKPLSSKFTQEMALSLSVKSVLVEGNDSGRLDPLCRLRHGEYTSVIAALVRH